MTKKHSLNFLEKKQHHHENVLTCTRTNGTFFLAQIDDHISLQIPSDMFIENSQQVQFINANTNRINRQQDH